MYGLGDAEDGCDALFDVVVGGGPVADADAHGGLALPDGAAAPAGAFLLNGGDGARVCSGVPKETRTWLSTTSLRIRSRRRGGFGQAAGLAAVAFDHLGEAATAEGAEGGIDRDGAGAAGFLRDELVGIAFGLVATM